MSLAFLQLWRAPVRTALLVFVVAMLIFLVEFLAMLSSTLQAFGTGAINHLNADVLIYSHNADGVLDASRVPAQVAASAARVPGVAAASVLAVADLTITGPGGTHELMLIGAGPGPAARPVETVSGRFPGQGELLADSTEAPAGLGVGDTVTVEPGGVPMHVVGTAPGIRYAEVTTAWTTYDTWVTVLKTANPAGQVQPNAVAVRAGPGVTASELVTRLTAAIPGVQVFTRAQAVANIPGATQTAATLDVLIAVAFIAALLVIGSVFLLITVQRSRVWILLRAIGSHAGRLSLVVMAQAAIVVVLASVVASVALAIVAAASGSNLPLHAAPSLMYSTTAAMLVGAAFTTLLPIRRIGRIDPAEAMGRA